MLRDVIDKWNQRKDVLRKAIEETIIDEDSGYKGLVEMIAIHIIGIDKGHLVLQEVTTDNYTGCNGYMFCEAKDDEYENPLPYDFYTAMAWHGSCNGCDAFLGILCDCDDHTEEKEWRTDQFMNQETIRHGGKGNGGRTKIAKELWTN